jgi:hypothetical protein
MITAPAIRHHRALGRMMNAYRKEKHLPPMCLEPWKVISLVNGYICRVYCIKDRPVGYILLEPCGHQTQYISEFFVMPSHRRRGIGGNVISDLTWNRSSSNNTNNYDFLFPDFNTIEVHIPLCSPTYMYNIFFNRGWQFTEKNNIIVNNQMLEPTTLRYKDE